MELLVILLKALLTLHTICVIFNLLMMIAPLTSQALHEEIVDDMKREMPDEGTPSRSELLFVCVVLAPIMTHWLITDLLTRGKK